MIFGLPIKIYRGEFAGPKFGSLFLGAGEMMSLSTRTNGNEVDF